MEEYLKASLIFARSMQLYYHYCHNLVTGKTFHQDHAFFSESYDAMESNYDALTEYFISIYGNSKFKTSEISKFVTKQLDGSEIESMCPCAMYDKALELEKEYQKFLEGTNAKARLGLQNAIQGMLTESDVRVYKIQQRTTEIEDEDHK